MLICPNTTSDSRLVFLQTGRADRGLVRDSDSGPGSASRSAVLMGLRQKTTNWIQDVVETQLRDQTIILITVFYFVCHQFTSWVSIVKSEPPSSFTASVYLDLNSGQLHGRMLRLRFYFTKFGSEPPFVFPAADWLKLQQRKYDRLQFLFLVLWLFHCVLMHFEVNLVLELIKY